jgi:hypothetical protein
MFKLIRYENARTNVPEPVFYQAKTGEEFHIGEALVHSDGVLTKCDATSKPSFIAMGYLAAGATNRKLAVCLVDHNMVFEAPINAAPTSIKVGNKVTLSTDGLGVTATTTSGVVTIESINGATAAGDTIVVRII